MAELRRTVSLHPREGGTFDVSLQTKDVTAHSALTGLNPTAGKQIEDILTRTTQEISTVLNQHVDWEKIGR